MKNFVLTYLFIFIALCLSAQCIDNGNYWNQSWVSCETSINPNPLRGNSHWILYEFDSPHAITESHIWNANRTGNAGRGAKDVVIDYSEDGTTWQELGTFEFPEADGSETYTGFAGPDFAGVFIQKILITVLTTHNGGNCASLAEVQFKIDADACYGIIDECGICDGSGELTWYLDADEDGLGDPTMTIAACEQPTGYVANNSDLCDDGAIAWEDVRVLFAENGCIGCHNANAAGGLDLRIYETTILGGNICGTNLLDGNNFVQTIITTAYDGCGIPLGVPSMNDRSSGEFDTTELAILQKWIDGGAPNECTAFNFGTLDQDQDGFIADEDCDDNDPNINPEAEEIPNNDIDEDCDGSDLTTSVYEINNVKITLYPNPVADVLQIKIEGNWNYQALLYDINGKLLFQKSNPTEISVSNLASGTYLIELEDSQTLDKITEQIIVAH